MFPTYAPRSRDAADPAPIGRPRAGSGCAALLAYSGTPAQAALLSGATCSRGAASPPFQLTSTTAVMAPAARIEISEVCARIRPSSASCPMVARVMTKGKPAYACAGGDPRSLGAVCGRLLAILPMPLGYFADERKISARCCAPGMLASD